MRRLSNCTANCVDLEREAFSQLPILQHWHSAPANSFIYRRYSGTFEGIRNARLGLKGTSSVLNDGRLQSQRYFVLKVMVFMSTTRVKRDTVVTSTSVNQREIIPR